MYSILEKTILLKSVDLFKNIPGDVLTRIAQISEEERPLANTLLFQEGDFVVGPRQQGPNGVGALGTISKVVQAENTTEVVT